ncbi:hypothetical protein RQP46_006632 [Phenoliferia psychrophenolica]
MLPILPPEIIDLIIFEASEDDLPSLARVSSTFLHPATKELYRTIHITYADSGSREAAEYFTLSMRTNDERVSQCRRQVLLLRTINRHAHLSNLVRHLSIHFNTVYEEATVSTELMLGLFLRACPLLSSVTYKGSTMATSKAVVGLVAAIPPQHLERFGPVMIYHDAEITNAFLATQPSLRSLVIACDRDQVRETPPSEAWPTHLETLRIRGDTIPPLAFSVLTSNSLHTITTLRITLERVDQFPDFSTLSSLSTLSIKLHRGEESLDAWPTPSDYDPLCKILSRCTKVVRFQIGIHDPRDRSHRGAVELILRHILPALPPNLVLLALSDRDREIPVDVVSEIVSSNAQPNLREVWVTAEPHKWVEWAAPAALELVRACEARGVVARRQDWNWETDP